MKNEFAEPLLQIFLERSPRPLARRALPLVRKRLSRPSAIRFSLGLSNSFRIPSPETVGMSSGWWIMRETTISSDLEKPSSASRLFRSPFSFPGSLGEEAKHLMQEGLLEIQFFSQRLQIKISSNPFGNSPNQGQAPSLATFAFSSIDLMFLDFHPLFEEEIDQGDPLFNHLLEGVSMPFPEKAIRVFPLRKNHRLSPNLLLQ